MDRPHPVGSACQMNKDGRKRASKEESEPTSLSRASPRIQARVGPLMLASGDGLVWLYDHFSTGCLFFLTPDHQLLGGDDLLVSRNPRYEEYGTIPKGVRVKCTYGPAQLQTLYQRVLVNRQPPLFGSGSIRSPTDPPAIRLYGPGNEDDDKRRSGKVLGILTMGQTCNMENRAANEAIEKGVLY